MDTEKQSNSRVSKYPPERLAGLIPWKPGQSGNPAGSKPKNKQLEELLEKHLSVKDKEGKTQDELMIIALIRAVIKGDVRAAQLLWDRRYGKVKDELEVLEMSVTIIREYVGERDDSRREA